MVRYLRLLALLSLAFLASGCGGSDSSFNNSVNSQNLSFQPRTLTVPVGTTVTWHNLDNTTHSVTSGTLDAVVDPTIQEVAIISAAFVPQDKEVRVGDTVRWTNNDLATHQIRFLPDQGIDFISSPFGQDQSVSQQMFTAGAFAYTDAFNSAMTGRITAVGVPNANGRFDSEGIPPGLSFSLTFNTRGTFSYFCKFHNIEEGEIVVQ